MSMKLPNYNDSLLAIAASIEKYYGIETPYTSMKEVDEELKKGYKHVFFWIVDAMGHYNLRDLAEEMPFIKAHEIRPISAIYPATTVAATTCAQTGIPPVVNGCVGWHQWFPEFDHDYVIFMNKGYYDGEEAPVNIEDDYLHSEEVYQKVAKTGKYGNYIFPHFKTEEVNFIQDQCNLVYQYANDPSKEGYVYVYWDKLDTYMHEYGIHSKEVRNHAKEINDVIENLVKKLPEDTLIIMTADHGHIDTEWIDLEEYPDIVATFEKNPTVESRAQSFYIKEDKKEEFVSLFNKYFGEYYHLFTHDEVFEKNILGDPKGHEHPQIHDFIGDYFNVATPNKS